MTAKDTKIFVAARWKINRRTWACTVNDLDGKFLSYNGYIDMIDKDSARNAIMMLGREKRYQMISKAKTEGNTDKLDKSHKELINRLAEQSPHDLLKALEQKWISVQVTEEKSK